MLLFKKGSEIKGQVLHNLGESMMWHAIQDCAEILHNLGESMMWHAIQDCAETYLSEKHVYR